MDVVKEISEILDNHCAECKVKSVINTQHGWTYKDRYCNEICKVGKRLAKLGKTLDYGAPVRKGIDLSDELYGLHKREGLTDREIAKLYNMGLTTLNRRKAHWGVSLPLKRLDILEKHKQDYLDLKVKGYTDNEICANWRIGKTTLRRWKKENNLRGGL